MNSPTLIMGSFGLMIKSDDQNIDLNKFTKSFDVDVEVNPGGTYLQQEHDGISVAVSKSYIKMCRPNKNQDIRRPEGFVKIQYSKKTKKQKNTALAGFSGRQTISRPSVGPIPQGVWCSICKNYGPYFHKENCSDPVDDKLRVTLFGFISCVIEGNKVNEDEDVVKLRDLFVSKMGDRTTVAKSEYIDLYNSFEFEVIGDSVYDWPLLNFHYKQLNTEVGPKNKKNKSFFSNCSIVSYNFKNQGSTSIRVYDSGLIHLVSCPWEHKDFYIKFVNQLNNANGIINKETGDKDVYIINTNESLVTTVFSSYSLLPDNLELNLKKLYNYFWPQDDSGIPILNNISPKRVFTKEYTYTGNKVDHNYLVNKFSNTIPFYRFEIEYRDDLSTPKIIMKLIPCLSTTKDKSIPTYCKPYKLTLMIFKSGKVQSIFSYCKEEDVGLTEDKLCDENPFMVPDNILDQYKDIQHELEQAMEFIYQSVENISNMVTVEVKSSILDKKDVNTVSGISPYREKEKIELGEIVEIFNKDTMEFDRKGKVIENEDEFSVEIMDEEDELTGELEDGLKISDIRSVIQSSMQVARSKKAGTNIGIKPDPYSFKGICPGGDKYYIPLEGMQARDNLYYPYCSVKKKDKYNIYIDQILNGFPNTEEEEIDFDIQKNADFDIYSGMIKPNVLEIGKSVKFKKNGNQYEGIITDTHRTSNKSGLDNVISYTVENNDEIFEINGSDLLLEYREDRRWEGLGNNVQLQRIKLMECANKLGLSQSPYTTENQNIKLQNKVMGYLKTITGSSLPFAKKTSVLTPTTFAKFKSRPYIAAAFPVGSQRVMLLSYKGKHYFIDEFMLIMKLDFNINSEITVLLDGYIKKTDVITYYPIDCMVFGKKLNINYFYDKDNKNDNDNEDNEDNDNDNDDEDNEDNEDNDDDEMVKFIETIETIDNFDKFKDIDGFLKYGRLFYTIMMSRVYSMTNNKNSIKFAVPEQYIAPFVGKRNILGKILIKPTSIKDRSIIEDINSLFKKSTIDLDLTFIPQKGTGNFLRWKRQLKTPIVLQLIKGSKNKYTVGVNKETIRPFNNTEINIPANIMSKIKDKKQKYIKFDLNFMSNGTLNPEEPLTLDVIEPVVTEEDILTHNRTQLIVDAMISPIPERVFRSQTEWKLVIPKYMVFNVDSINPGTNPLILTD